MKPSNPYLRPLRIAAQQLLEAAELEHRARVRFDEGHPLHGVLAHNFSDANWNFNELLNLAHPVRKPRKKKRKARQ